MSAFGTRVLISFFQTFKEVRLKDRSLGRAPGAAFSPNPPLELKGFSVNNDSDVLGYISFGMCNCSTFVMPVVNFSFFSDRKGACQLSC